MFGGVLGDRLSRRTMMRTSMAGAALAQGVTAWALITGRGSLALLAVVGMVIGALGALGGPSSSAMTQQTVPAALLRQAVVWRRLARTPPSSSARAARACSSSAFGSGWALAVDAVTFAAAAVAFSRIDVPPVVSTEERQSMWGDVAAGFREVMRHTWLWLLILQALLYHLFYGGAQSVLGPIVVGDTIGRAAWGYALAAMMAGFVIGGLVTVRWKPRRALYVGVWFLALTAAFPFAMAWSDALAVVLVGAFVHGFGLEIFSVGWDLSIQENVAPDKLARVYAFDLIGSFVARPVGLALTGPIAQLVGYDVWLTVVGSVIIASVVVSLFAPDVRRLERRPDVDEAVPV